MNERDLQKVLSDLPLGHLRYFDTIGSTNDEALAWATDGAPDLSLVVADEQTAGRGRLGRKWFTPPGTGLAFSLILRPTEADRPFLSRTVGLAAEAIADSLKKLGLIPKIKWPNDVLVQGRKISGILVESVWTAEELDCQVIGMGINIRKEAVPSHVILQFPATSLEQTLGSPPGRSEVLHDILSALIELRPKLGTDEFLKAWEENLAYRGELIQIEGSQTAPITGELLSLESDGSLRLRDEHGNPITVRVGDVSLRPAA
jgi:BirA family biotin operon repressor/biotin-[acetyl-CoA-carboxylase] ligase